VPVEEVPVEEVMVVLLVEGSGGAPDGEESGSVVFNGLPDAFLGEGAGARGERAGPGAAPSSPDEVGSIVNGL